MPCLNISHLYLSNHSTRETFWINFAQWPPPPPLKFSSYNHIHVCEMATGKENIEFQLYSPKIKWNVAVSLVVFIKRALYMALGQGFTVYVTQHGYIIVFLLALKTGTLLICCMSSNELRWVVQIGAICELYRFCDGCCDTVALDLLKKQHVADLSELMI